jgi:hypothetical protein
MSLPESSIRREQHLAAAVRRLHVNVLDQDLLDLPVRALLAVEPRSRARS